MEARFILQTGHTGKGVQHFSQFLRRSCGLIPRLTPLWGWVGEMIRLIFDRSLNICVDIRSWMNRPFELKTACPSEFTRS